METMNKLLIRPISWSSVNPDMNAIKSDPTLMPCIQIFGYTSDGRTVYVRIPKKSTFIVRFGEEVDDDVISNISEILNPSNVKKSYIDDNILIIRAPEMSPIELAGNSEYDNIATWIEAKQDPYGELESLWEAKEIGPYEWMYINKFSPIPGRYTICDLNIKTDEDQIVSGIDVKSEIDQIIFPRLLFWDIEVLVKKKGQFPDSTDDMIIMVSIITVSRDGQNNYVIYVGNVNPDIIINDKKDLVLIKTTDEKDLMRNFFAIYNTFGPDRVIYYNGDLFDLPYLLDRLSINNYEIPKISKISTLNLIEEIRDFPTAFGREPARTISIPGTEIIDLIHYYRRFYPYLKNYKLDTVANELIEDGKTDLTIDEMIEAFKSNDPKELSKFIEYSYNDSLLMKKLWDLDVQSNLETVCNNLGIDINTILRSSFDQIVDRIVYNIDAGASLIKGKNSKPSYLKEASRGIYRNIYIYDYSELYRSIMLLSENLITSTLGNRLEGAPPKLILTAFYSGYVNRDELMESFNNKIDELIKTDMIIAIEPFIIRSIGPLDITWLKEVDVVPCYVSVSKASYIIINRNGDIEKAGLAKLCRPKFKLVEDVINQYLSIIYSGDDIEQFIIPDLLSLPHSKFILTERLDDNSIYSSSIKQKLTSQYGETITVPISLEYIMTLRGPILLSQIKSDDIIDPQYYLDEINKYIRDLQSLKVYGV